MFYRNGLIKFVYSDKIDDVIRSCFEGNNRTNGCLSMPWGLYEIHNDTIKTQIFQDDGYVAKFTIFTDFIIKSPTELICINHYCISKSAGNCYLYPIYSSQIVSTFFPLTTKRDWRECSLLKKKWFLQKPK
jgi:hypothetical protein